MLKPEMAAIESMVFILLLLLPVSYNADGCCIPTPNVPFLLRSRMSANKEEYLGCSADIRYFLYILNSRAHTLHLIRTPHILLGY